MTWELVDQSPLADVAAPIGTNADLDLIARLERTANAAKARGIPEHEVVSPAGAIGRYQIMPGTARQYGYDPARLRDPAYNETVAKTILADLAKRFPDDAAAQAVAYHSGPGAAQKFLASGRSDRVLGPRGRDYLARALSMTGATGGIGAGTGPVGQSAPPQNQWELVDQKPLGSPASSQWQLADQTPPQPPAPPRADPSLANEQSGAFIRNVAQGVTFNTADEIASALAATIGDNPVSAYDAIGTAIDNVFGSGSGKTWRERYEEGLSSNRAQDRANAEAYPVTSTAGQLTGAIAPIIATMGAAAPATIMGRMATGTALGTGAGAASGFGAGEGESDRLQSALTGGIFGGVLGAILPGVAGFVGRAVERPALSSTTFAKRYAGRALRRDSVPLDEAKAALSQPGTSIADLGKESVVAAGEQAALAGEGRALATALYGARSAGAEGRMSRAVLNAVSDKDMYSVVDDLTTQRAASARPLYEAAYAAPYTRTDALVDLSRRPAIGAAVKSAITRVANDPDVDPAAVRSAMTSLFGKNVEQLSEPQIAARLTQALAKRPIEFRVLDYIKRGLDDLSSQPGASNEIRKLRNAWRAELDNVNPKYRAARSAWAGPSRMMEAIDEGRNFMREDPEAITRSLASMGASEQEAYRIGVARALNDEITRGGHGAVTTARRLSGSTAMKQRVMAALGGDDAAYKRLMSHAEDLIRQTSRGAATLGGSQTARRLEDSKEFEQLQPFLDELIASSRSGITGIAASTRQYVGRWASKAIMDRLHGMSKSRRAALAKLLFSTDRADNLRAIEQIYATPQSAPILSYRRPIASTAISGYVGSQQSTR